MPATDLEIYHYAQRAYSPVFAIRVWAVLVNGGGFGAAVRRSFQHEIEERKAV